MKGQVAILMGVKDIALKQFDLPPVEPGALLLEVVKANVCGSDLHIWRGLHPVIKKGVVMGHEFVGRVLKLGEGVTTDYAGSPVKVGDRVVAPYFLTCLKCPPCLRGSFLFARTPINSPRHRRRLPLISMAPMPPIIMFIPTNTSTRSPRASRMRWRREQTVVFLRCSMAWIWPDYRWEKPW